MESFYNVDPVEKAETKILFKKFYLSFLTQFQN